MFCLGGIYIDVCYCDMFSVVNVYLDHLKFCVVCINGRRYVCCGECYVVSNECDEPTSWTPPQLHAGGVGRQQPTSCPVQPIVAHCCEVMYFVYFVFRGELRFLNCDDIGMCVVNKEFEFLEISSHIPNNILRMYNIIRSDTHIFNCYKFKWNK